MNNNDKLKKTIKISIIIVITALCVVLGIMANQKYKEGAKLEEDLKIEKGNEIFCDGKCENEEDDKLSIGLTVMSSFKCEICEEVRDWGSSITPVICEECAQLTQRCKWCGKIEEVKE